MRALHSSVPLSLIPLAPLAAITFTVGACALDEPPAESTVASALCGIILCGDNAPTAGDGLLFDEWDLFGRPNYAGVRMTGAHLDNGHEAKVQIVLDELRALDMVTSTQYAGWQLWHMIIDFEHVPTRTVFQIRLESYDPQSVTFQAGAQENVPLYAFKSRLGRSGQFNFDVCNNGTLAPDPTWSGLDHYALLYRGDRYDPNLKRLKPNNPGDGWSFLACNGGAGTKMHLWRHTYAGGFNNAGNPVYMTNDLQRTTLLKAITADYCGTGTPQFTVMGTHIAFATAQEPLSFPAPRPPGSIRSIEAMWGPGGAECLDYPRIVARPNVEGACKKTFPPCAPPTATDPPYGWWTSHYAVTANPL